MYMCSGGHINWDIIAMTILFFMPWRCRLPTHLAGQPQGLQEPTAHQTTREHPADDAIKVPLEGRVPLEGHCDAVRRKTFLKRARFHYL